MSLYVTLAVSILVNVLIIWYSLRLLRKFMYISETIGDLYLTTKAFQIFVKGMYSMDRFHGEPMVQELIMRLREVSEEIELFRSVFEHSLDQELEEELNAREAEDKEEA
jgi:hypothetical protein